MNVTSPITSTPKSNNCSPESQQNILNSSQVSKIFSDGQWQLTICSPRLDLAEFRTHSRRFSCKNKDHIKNEGARVFTALYIDLALYIDFHSFLPSFLPSAPFLPSFLLSFLPSFLHFNESKLSNNLESISKRIGLRKFHCFFICEAARAESLNLIFGPTGTKKTKSTYTSNTSL